MIISSKISPQRLLQAGDIVVDSAKMADMPKPIPIVNPVAYHALTSVAVDLLGTGATNHRIEVSLGSLAVDRDILETTPDVLVGKESNLGLPDLVQPLDRSEQRIVGQGHLLVTNALQS
jgi:hypothetical protein